MAMENTITVNKKGFKETKLGSIPKDWEVVKLENAIVFLDNKRKPIKSEDRSKRSGVYPYYGASGVIDYIDDYIFDDNLILLGEDGANVIARSTPLAFKVTGKIWVNNHAHVLKPKKDYDLDYLVNFLESIKYDKYNTSKAQPKLNKDVCARIPILKPSFKEQFIIGHCLTTWDVVISKQDALIKAKQTLKKALMQQLLNGKKRLSGFSDEWKEKKLDFFFDERSERNNKGSQLLSIGEAGVYPQDNSNKKDTSNNDKSKYKKICVGDIGYNSMRMWQGRSALSSLEGIVSPAYTIVKPKKNTDSQFFAYLFKDPAVIHRFFRNSQGMVSDTLNCKFKDFAIIKLLLPINKEEQIAIAQVLKTADQEISLLTSQRNQLQLQKKGLMQQLLTGKKRLKI